MLLFRIDKNLVSFEQAETAYNNIGAELRRLDQHARKLQEEAERKKKEQELKFEEGNLKKIVAEAEEKAGAILSEAKAQALAIVEKARAEADGVREKARDEGYAEGSAKADGEIEKRCKEKSAALENLLTELSSTWDSFTCNLENEIITIVLETTKKVINVALEKDDKLFVDLIQNATSQIKHEGKIVVRVSKEEYNRIFESGSSREFLINNEQIKATIIEEPLFEKGDCVIESEGETVNAGINSQLKYIELAFRGQEDRKEVRKESGKEDRIA